MIFPQASGGQEAPRFVVTTHVAYLTLQEFNSIPAYMKVGQLVVVFLYVLRKYRYIHIHL